MNNHDKHIMLWNELALTGSRQKYDTSVAKQYNKACFACSEALEKNLTCKECPVDWNAESCSEATTLYTKWINETSEVERRKLAAQIRDLPWRLTNKSKLTLLKRSKRWNTKLNKIGLANEEL